MEEEQLPSTKRDLPKLDRHVVLKSATLRAIQRQNLNEFWSRLPELGWDVSQLSKNDVIGYVFPTGQPKELIFAQVVLDQHIDKVYHAYVSVLPAHCRIHQLPRDRVGGLATLQFGAFVGFAEDPAEDCICFFAGLTMLPFWGRAVFSAMGIAQILQENQCDDPEFSTQFFWQENLRDIALNVLGYPVDPVFRAKMALWSATREKSVSDTNLRAVLEGFVVYHEVAHYELQHGKVLREFAGDVTEIVAHWQEHEADMFALRAVLAFVADDRPTVASGLVILFVLFCLHPDLAEALPACNPQRYHPHPLTRLSWLLDKLFADNREMMSTRLRHASNILGIAMKGEWGSRHDEYVQDIWARTLLAPAPEWPLKGERVYLPLIDAEL